MTAEELIAKVKTLTPVSHAALNLVSLLDQPAISNDEIVNVLKYDKVLTAKLLRACNSPFFGLEEPIASVAQAVLILGHQQILHMALSIAFSSRMAASAPTNAAEAQELWRHSLVTAMAAENIARNNHSITVEPSVAFTAGLLHDFGKVVLNHVLPQDLQSSLRARMAQDGCSRREAEKEVIGVDHAEAGKCLLQAWRLPESIIEAVANHHTPVSKPQPQLSSLVHAANCIAHSIASNSGWEVFAARADAGAVAALGIDREKLDELLASSQDWMSQVDNLMKMG